MSHTMYISDTLILKYGCSRFLQNSGPDMIILDIIFSYQCEKGPNHLNVFFIGKFQFTFTINCPKLLKFTNKPTTSTVQKRTWWVDHWLISIFSAIIVKVTVTPRIKPHKEKPTHSSTTDYEESRPQWQPHNLLCESHKNKPKIFTCRLRAQNRTQSV